ncbi:MAG: Fic family protein [Candidatus Vogelbacteria bacterium]|nr:Fic family protein [Candidatus Vogelbacteria bacterium]
MKLNTKNKQTNLEASDTVELISFFAETWLSLGSYDKGELPKGKPTKRSVQLTADRLHEALVGLRNNLVTKEEATEMFGSERHDGAIAGIVGNVMQSFSGQEMYPSVEEKAAHLLYFMVKNHPFTDGNKRSGAYAFVWFLQQAKLLNTNRLSPPALTALTIVVAESDPTHKDRVIDLVLNLISSKR